MSHVSRRDALRYAAAAAAVVGSGVAAQSLAGESSAAAPAPGRTDPRDFEISYRGKKIRGVHGGARVGSLRAQQEPHRVQINGRDLSVMPIELPTGLAYISALNHYEPVSIDEDRNADGLLTLAKRAVDALGNTELTALAGMHHHHGR